MNNNKIVVLGDSTVGKSSILHYFKNKLFMKDIETTIGCDFFARNVTFENKNVKLLIWDTAGQEIFRSFTPNFLRGSSVIIIVYDTSNIDSFNNIKIWLEHTEARPEAKIVICGNKSDLKSKIKSLFYIEQLKQLFPNKEIHHFGNVSAKLGTNIEELFIFVAKLTLNMNTNNNSNLYNNTINLDNSTIPNINNNCSC
tara:strand:+ start:82 stop:675 length:594 start_codon:yes stop_codon:yes gene_type:complete